MSGLKVIRRRISSVNNTRQITRAMKLVSAAKLRRAHDAAVFGRQYLTGLESVLQITARLLPESFSHPLLQSHEEAQVRKVVVIAGERGLCGAYNTNLLKTVDRQERLFLQQAGRGGETIDFLPIGRRAVAYARRMGWSFTESFEGLSENVKQWPIEEIISIVRKDFEAGKIREAVIYYTSFAGTLSQEVKCETLFPFNASAYKSAYDEADKADSYHGSVGAEGDYKFSPDAVTIFSSLISLVVQTKLLQAILEAKASEHASRMTAMDAATNNANELIEKLRLHYNRARQSTITRELIDIVGGAEATK